MLIQNDYFPPDQEPPEEPEAPEAMGAKRFFGILLPESGALLKLNTLFLLTCVPLVTVPPALLALSRSVRRLLEDKPARASGYWEDFKGAWPGGWGAFVLTALPLLAAGYGMLFYLRFVEENWLLLVPFLFCSTAFLTALMGSAYLWGLLACGRKLGRGTVRLALRLGLARPLRAVLASAVWYVPLAAAVLCFPLSATYLLLIGFSVPALAGHFFLRTVVGNYLDE